MTLIFCKKNGPKRSFQPEIGAQTFYYPIIGGGDSIWAIFGVPTAAVFHDKAKRTQQGDLLEKLPKLTQNIDPFPVLPTLLFRSSDLPKVGRRG